MDVTITITVAAAAGYQDFLDNVINPWRALQVPPLPPHTVQSFLEARAQADGLRRFAIKQRREKYLQVKTELLMTDEEIQALCTEAIAAKTPGTDTAVL